MLANQSSSGEPRAAFVFHGQSWPFFKICLINLLLTIVTLGIYLPWAFVKSRRYIYENMELHGVRFNYHATGGAFFVSWLLIGVLFLVATLVCAMISPNLSLIPFLLLLLLMPLMAIAGLRYQAQMTTLNGVRFSFKCGMGKAFWVMLLLPVLLSVAIVVVITMVSYLFGEPQSLTGVFVHLSIIVLLALLLVGVSNGIIYGKWMQLLGNHASFGIHRFSTQVSLKRCVVISLAAMLILAPFIFVIGRLLSGVFMSMILMAGLDEASRMAMLMEYQVQLVLSYLLYFVAIILSSVFIVAMLRNLFINALRLGDTLTFRSSITFIGLLMQILVLSLVTIFTLGLAYPWGKMRLMRYLAENTAVVGNLDEVELVDSDESPDTGFLTVVSRGTMPAIPFI